MLARWEGEWEEYEFAYSGEIFAFDKYHSSHDDYRITQFENGMNLKDSYQVSVTMNGYNLNPHILEVADDALFMFGNLTDGTKTEIVRLTENDYRMYINSITVTTTDVDRETGSTVKTDPFDVIIEGKRTNDGPWEYIATQRINNSGTSYTPKAALFETPYVAMRIRGAEAGDAYSRLYMNVGVEIYADSPVVQKLLELGVDLKTIELHNYSIHEIYLDDGEGNFVSTTHYATPTLLDNVGTTELNAADYAANGYYYLRDKASCVGGRQEKYSYITKRTQSVVNDTLNSKVDVQFNVRAYEYVASNIVPEAVASIHMDEAVFYDLLPRGYTYLADKGVKVSGFSSGISAAITKVEIVDNYKGSGRQLVKFFVKYTGEEGQNMGMVSYNSGYGHGSGFEITFWSAISWKELTYFPYGYNLVAFQEGDGGTGRLIAKAGKDDGAPLRDYFKEALDANGDPVFMDINGDGLTDRQDTLFAASYVNPDFIGAYQIGIAKLVKANSGYYRIHDVADLGGTYSYKLSFSASDQGFTKDLVMFDILEDAANTEGYRDETFWKGTFAGVSTRMPELQGIAPVVYYSTRTGLNSNRFETTDEVPNAKAYLKDTEIWSTTPPDDLSKVTAVAFDLSTKTNGEPYVFEAQSATEVEIFMTAPEELPEAPLAYNRFSYSSIFSADTTFDTRSKHNIGHRVTVELQDLKDFTFIKRGENIEEEEPFVLTGTEFKLYRCIHEHEPDCGEGCVHTHNGKPGEETSCWTALPAQIAYGDAEGRVTFKGLASGEYALVESSTTNGFVLPENTWWLINVVATYDGGVSDPVNAGTASNHLSFQKDEDSGEWVLINKRIYRPYQISKTWIQDAGKTFQPSEIIVDLYRNNEPYIMGISLNTGNNFYMNLGKLPYCDPFGKTYGYKFVERPVDGYSGSVSSRYRYERYEVTVTNTRLGILDIVKKAVNGDPDDLFSFVVALKDSENEPVEAVVKVETIASDGSSASTEVASDEEGKLVVSCKRDETIRIKNIPLSTTYMITEVDKPGYSSAVTEGTVSGTTSYSTIPSVTFTNTYSATGELNLFATKLVNGAQPREDQVFQFQLLQNNEVLETVTNDGGRIAFSTLTYTLEDLAASPLTYQVKESSESGNGYTPDDAVYTVFVWLKDNKDGTLETKTICQNGADVVEELLFENRYEASGSYSLNAGKRVNGQIPLEHQVYSFELVSTDDAPQIQLMANNAGGEIVFEPIQFTVADAGKTYTYSVKESTVSQGDLIADDTVYTVKLFIEDLKNGQLSVTPAFFKGEAAVDEVMFDNILYAPLTIAKVVDGPATEEAFPFTIHLYEADGAESTQLFDYTGSLNGTLTSGDMICLRNGEQITLNNIPLGMTYMVEEDPGTRYSCTVDGQSTNVAQGACQEGGSQIVFSNTLVKTSISVEKEWRGNDGGDIELTLFANGVKVDPQPVCHRDGQTYSFTDLPRFDRQGQVILYSVKEKYMDGYVTIYQNVAPHQSETQCVYDGGTIVNREVTTFRIRKVWMGIEGKQPPKIKLTLYCNGQPYNKSQPEPDDNGWYVYKNLPKYVDGKLALYTIWETQLDGYETTYHTADGELAEAGYNGGKIVNTRLPVTGDKAVPALWICLMALSAFGAMCLIRRRQH